MQLRLVAGSAQLLMVWETPRVVDRDLYLLTLAREVAQPQPLGQKGVLLSLNTEMWHLEIWCLEPWKPWHDDSREDYTLHVSK